MISAIDKAQPRPLSHVLSSIFFKLLLKIFLEREFSKLQAIIRSHAGSPMPTSEKSITALRRYQSLLLIRL